MKTLTRYLAVFSLLFVLFACQTEDNEFVVTLRIETDDRETANIDVSTGDGDEQEITIEVPPSDCGDVLNGAFEQRTKYLNNVVDEGACFSEIQTRVCLDGQLSEWSGSYQFDQCSVTSSNSTQKITIDDVSYQGGFRLSASKYGDADYATLAYSPGAIALNKENNSLYVVSHAYHQGIGEFEIPEITNSRDIADFKVGSNVLQSYATFHNTDRVNTGIDNYFKVTGMEKIGDKLVVNYFNWYDAEAKETDTTVVFNNADNLAGSEVFGPFQIEGAARAGGWLTPVPAELQSSLGGTYISGWSSGSIISRLSVGPSAYVQTPEDNLLISTSGGAVNTTALLSFPLANILYDYDVYPDGYTDSGSVLYNGQLNNDLWTVNSEATYGFIIPGTDTYMTVGGSAGHEGGLGYKITQDNGNVCGGPCPYLADDRYPYYWLWSVSDLIKVKNGELLPYQVRPYEYGKLNIPTKSPVSGGAYDYENNLLYLSVAKADYIPTYDRPPIFFVLKITP